MMATTMIRGVLVSCTGAADTASPASGKVMGALAVRSTSPLVSQISAVHGPLGISGGRTKSTFCASPGAMVDASFTLKGPAERLLGPSFNMRSPTTSTARPPVLVTSALSSELPLLSRTAAKEEMVKSVGFPLPGPMER